MDYVTGSGADKFENDNIVVNMKLKDYAGGSQSSRVMSEASICGEAIRTRIIYQ
jgi:hypothetical protein